MAVQRQTVNVTKDTTSKKTLTFIMHQLKMRVDAGWQLTAVEPVEDNDTSFDLTWERETQKIGVKFPTDN